MNEITVNSQFLGLKDITVHVEDTGGAGRPVILIHGWPLSGKSWKNQIDALRDAGFRVITYDRRGFGESDKPATGYNYDAFAEDLSGLIKKLDLKNISLIGFSMGGGEIARYISTYGEELLTSVVFASSVTPMMLKSTDNPDGPLDTVKAEKMSTDLTSDQHSFYDQFTKDFFSAHADGNILITDAERMEALALCMQADPHAAKESMQSFANTDFREDIKKVTVPTLIIHGDADAIVPFAGSGKRTHAAIVQSELQVIKGGPHGIMASHVEEFNTAIIAFLRTN